MVVDLLLDQGIDFIDFVSLLPAFGENGPVVLEVGGLV